MDKKWMPCFCTIILGIAVIVFTWWQLSWAQIALTVVGALVIVKGLVGVCCCNPSGKGSSCCS